MIKHIEMELINHSQTAVKTLAFERQETHQIKLVDQPLHLRGLHHDIRPLLTQHCPQQTRIALYHPRLNTFTPLPQDQLHQIERSLLQPSFLLFRYRLDNPPPPKPTPDLSSEEQKDPRSKERTIGEVIELVKRWREMYIPASKSSPTLKRRNLQEAARELGVSKKSLDDYYCQLRLAEHYNFDFSSKINEKMGVLRSYVKDCKPENDEKMTRHHKHPKILRIIDEYEPNFRSVAVPLPIVLPPTPKLHPAVSLTQQVDQGEDSNNPFVRELFNLQQQFYKGFAFGFDDPVDPFLQMSDPPSKRSFEDSDNFIF